MYEMIFKEKINLYSNWKNKLIIIKKYIYQLHFDLPITFIIYQIIIYHKSKTPIFYN